uniref:cobalamin-binding protein n=1 Tax=Piscinibacter sp. XHJ-5 TaxID=3037797 RepID=UPI002453529F|nr:cobalamin-binding protein [Piscinibacter sp. XHJ-5]
MRWLAAIVLCIALAARAATHVDDAGRVVDLPSVPQRVITLAPNLTEFVYAAGAGDTLVGTMDTSNYPEAAKRVTRIGDYQRLDVERILSLRPELILVWHHGNQGRELGQLEAAGLRLFYLEPKRIDDVPRALSRVGALLGREGQARQQATALQRDLDALRERHAASSPVSVFFQVWSQPLMTLNGQHLTSDILALCGGRNVFASLPALAPQVSLESVVAADPEVLLTARESADEGLAWRREPKRQAFATWQAFPRLTAVRRGWMYSVPGDLITRQGPRIVDGVRAVCAALDEVRRERGR